MAFGEPFIISLTFFSQSCVLSVVLTATRHGAVFVERPTLTVAVDLSFILFVPVSLLLAQTLKLIQRPSV